MSMEILLRDVQTFSHTSTGLKTFYVHVCGPYSVFFHVIPVKFLILSIHAVEFSFLAFTISFNVAFLEMLFISSSPSLSAGALGRHLRQLVPPPTQDQPQGLIWSPKEQPRGQHLKPSRTSPWAGPGQAPGPLGHVSRRGKCYQLYPWHRHVIFVGCHQPTGLSKFFFLG